MHITVDLKQADRGHQFLTYGWGAHEADCVWTNGRTSQVVLPRISARHELFLLLDAKPWIYPPLIFGQVVRVSVNGSKLGTCDLRSRAVMQFTLQPEDNISNEQLVIEIENPCFVRPHILGYEADKAAYGIAIFSITITDNLEDIEHNQKDSPVILKLIDRPAKPEQTGVLYERDDTPAPQVSFEQFLGAGWYKGNDGALWTAACVSQITIRCPTNVRGQQVRIALAPLRIRSWITHQRLTIILSGLVIGQFRLRDETSLVVPVPDEAFFEKAFLEIVLVTPDSISMDDFESPEGIGSLGIMIDQLIIEPAEGLGILHASLRDEELDVCQPQLMAERFVEESSDELSKVLEASLGIRPSDMLRMFESLGDSCAFGLVQRKVGAEVLGLLRFGSTPISALMKGLCDRFAALDNHTDLEVELSDTQPQEFLLRSKSYGIRWHTLTYQTKDPSDFNQGQQLARLTYLRRRFLEGIKAGRKIYVLVRAASEATFLMVPRPKDTHVLNDRFFGYSPGADLTLSEVLPVWQQLNGQHYNTLLFIVRATKGKRPGSVELLTPGVLRGFVGSPNVSDDIAVHDYGDWLRVLANAWGLVHLQNTRSSKKTGGQGSNSTQSIGIQT